MKNIILLFFVSVSLQLFAIETNVDERVEFVMGAAGAAGYTEFKNTKLSEYTNEVQTLFDDFRNHSALTTLKELRKAQAIGYDAISSLAIHTDIENGHLVIPEGVDLTADDSRWKPGQEQELVKLLDDLYRKTNFHEFFLNKKEFYNLVEDRGKVITADVDFDWLEKFYGKPMMGSRLILALNQVGNYGCTRRVPGLPDEAVIMPGCRRTDSIGLPQYRKSTALIVHEASHPMLNPLVSQHIHQIERQADLAAELFSEELVKQSYYGGPTLMYESMVRAATIFYYKSHDEEYKNWMRREMKRGYIFMPEIISAFENKGSAPVDSIMPEIVEAINNVDITARYTEVHNSGPHILGCSLSDGAIIECDSVAEVKVFFDRPFKGFGSDFYNDNEDMYPEFAKIPTRDGSVLTLFLEVEPGKEYGLVLPGLLFRDDADYPGQGEAVIHFFTK